MKHQILRRMLSALMAGVLCISCMCSPAFAAGESPVPKSAVSVNQTPVESAAVPDDGPAEHADAGKDESQSGSIPAPESEPAQAVSGPEQEEIASMSESTSNEAVSESDASVPESTPANSTDDEAALGAEAQAFVDAVNALDRESILEAVNTWALASKAWQAQQDNEELHAALEQAIAASDEAAAPVYAAEDLYNDIPEDERGGEEVAAAYTAWAALVTAMQAILESPAQQPEEAGTPPDETEIARVLYGDLPDAPTGSYMGSYGLPVATGETKIGISAWHDELMVENAGHMDAGALNADKLEMTVPLEAGESYAVVPVMVQVEYPANGSTSEIILPDSVTLLNYDGAPASGEEAEAILHASYTESSAAAAGFYVRAYTDFTVRFRYTAPKGNSLEKELYVHVDEAAEAAASANGVSTYAAERPTPSVTTGRITAVRKVNGSWLIWFNGQEAYCCTHGANGQPNGCPLYTYSHTSIVAADQYTPGDHYANQVNIWGGLGQLSLNMLTARHADGLSASTFTAGGAETAPDVLETAYTYYDDVQLWIMENYPNSVAARSYLSAAEQLSGGATTFAADSDYYTYIYIPPAGYPWQTVAVIGPPTGSVDPDIPPAGAEYYASWSAAPQTASGSFDASYTVNVNKEQLEAGERADGATIEIEPLEKGGVIDGGTWAITPAGVQTVTTNGHTQDSNYQYNGGEASASWSLRYEVSKTSVTSLSGREGPYKSQAEADAAAASAQSAAESQLRAEAQGMVDRAIAAAKEQLATLNFRFDETVVPYGFEFWGGAQGGKQTITVPMNSSDRYLMRNDEWSLQVNLRKVDSETGRQIAGDALYEVYEWDTVAQAYMPYNLRKPKGAAPVLRYNGYRVERNEDGTYSVVNDSSYGTEFDTSRTMYYTQRNEGKFIIVETRAPSGYYGDWTDVEHPGTAGTPLGKRAYYIEIIKETDGSVLWLDNRDYNADIAMRYEGGTKLMTSDGTETTVIIGDYKDAGRTYDTDNSKTAANEDSYTMAPQEDVFQNDRVLGEISLSKVDLDAGRYVDGRDTDGDALVSGQAHADARLDGAVYDLYAAEDIQHPDGVSGVVDYSKITDADGTPIWHTTIRDNAGVWHDDYLPVLKKDHLVASAEIRDGWLTFSNLYLGKYYIVERGTGAVIPVEDGAYKLSGSYPTIDGKTKQPDGGSAPLAMDGQGRYTDYVYRHQWSSVGQSKALDGTKTYDGYYESYAKGYLCDEHNYYITPVYSDEGWYIEKTAFADDQQAAGEQRDTTGYSGNVHLHRDNGLAESQDQVMKGNVELSKHVSSTGSSDGLDLEGAGFTFFLISDLSREDEFATTRSGQYILSSILKAYLNPEYDESSPKYNFSGEAQAIAKTYEADASQIEAYNATLTQAGDFKNGSGEGWVPTGRPNEYQLAEIFSNDTGTIRVQGLPYGQYLVVETTVPKDVFQAQPFIVTIDPADEHNPQSGMADPKDAVQIPSDSYQKYTVLDEELEVYLRITKIDEETGKPVLLPDTAFQIYWMDEQGRHILDDEGNVKLVTMTDTENGQLTKDIDTFYTNENGVLTLPERLPLGHFRLVEVQGPDGFYNEWADSAKYEDGSLQADDTGSYADGTFYVDFAVTTDRVYEATGDDSENSQDIVVIDEEYHNRETLGMLTIRKTGEVLAGWAEDDSGVLDPQFSGEAWPGHFVYEERPVPNAEYTITANENIYTQDRQTDANGNRTMWYAEGDVVAVVRTGDGTSSIARFSPGRTSATYEFLSVIHEAGAVGEVSVTLPLGSYHIEETTPPYGFTDTRQSYDVTFEWDEQTNSVVMAKTIVSNGEDGDVFDASFEVEDAGEAGEELTERQTLKFRNEREKAKIKVCKRDSKTDELVPGAVFNLYTQDDIYSADGELLFRAGDLVATSEPTDENGWTTFSCDLPGCGENYGRDGVYIPENSYGTGHNASQNSGRFVIRELRPPQGYFLNDTPMEFAFTYDGRKEMVFEHTCRNKATTVDVSKRELTGDEELPGATLTIQNEDGETVRQWVSGSKPMEIRGLHLNEVYTLTESIPAKGHALAEDIRFKLVQRADSGGDLLDENDVYICTGKDWLFFDHWEKLEDGMVVMRDDITRVEISKQDITSKDELPGAHLVLKDAEGTVVEEWVSTDKPYYIEMLPAGHYELIEECAPAGYKTAESIQFEVKPTGEVQKVVMYDERQPAPEPPAPVPPTPSVPQTGDIRWLPAALIGIGAAAAGGLAALRIRKKRRGKYEAQGKNK